VDEALYDAAVFVNVDVGEGGRICVPLGDGQNLWLAEGIGGFLEDGPKLHPVYEHANLRDARHVITVGFSYYLLRLPNLTRIFPHCKARGRL
jgi:hypothetical protein